MTGISPGGAQARAARSGVQLWSPSATGASRSWGTVRCSPFPSARGIQAGCSPRLVGPLPAAAAKPGPDPPAGSGTGHSASSGPGSRHSSGRSSEGFGAGRGFPGIVGPGGEAGLDRRLRSVLLDPSQAFRAPGPASSFIDRARSRPIHPGARGAPLPWQPPPRLPGSAQPERGGGRGPTRGPCALCACEGGSWQRELHPGVPSFVRLQAGGAPAGSAPPGFGAAAATSAGAAPASLPRAGAGARPRRFPSWAGLGAA